MPLPFLSTCVRLVIAEHLDPITTFNYAITCKEHWDLCRLLIEEHSRLFSECKVIDTSKEGVTSWSVLKEVLLNPRKAWYVKELNLPTERRYSLDFDPVEDEDVDDWQLPEEDVQLFTKAARALTTLYPLEGIDQFEGTRAPLEPPSKVNIVAFLEKCVAEDPSDDAVNAILIHYLPNLETLRVTVRNPGCLELMMGRINFESRDLSKKLLLPLRRLKTMAVAYSDSELACDPDWALHSQILPGLQTFVASSMGGHFEYERLDAMSLNIEPPLSNITELFLPHCQFDPGVLDKILSGIKALEKFTYQCAGPVVSGEATGPKRIMESLERYAGHSLQTLFFEYECPRDEIYKDDETCVDIRDFRKLKVLTCDWTMLWPDAGIDMMTGEPLEEVLCSDSDTLPEMDIRDILPESLQELYLSGEFNDEREWERLVGPFESPNDGTPNLNKIRVTESFANVEPIVFATGGAQEPISLENHPLFSLLDGHHYEEHW